MKESKDIQITRLQEQVKNIKDNDLVHLAGDIKRVEDKVDTAHEKIDVISDKVAFLSGKNVIIGAIIVALIDLAVKYLAK